MAARSVMGQGVARAIEARASDEPLRQLPLPLRAMFEEHAAFAFRSLRWLGVRKSELDDSLKQVFSIAHQETAARKQPEHVRAWLYSICARVARSQRRDRRRVDTPPEVLGEDAAPAASLERFGQRAAATLGRRLLSELPPLEREVFVLYEVESMPLPEVAEALSCSLRRARARLRAARERVLAEVERMAAEGDHD